MLIFYPSLSLHPMPPVIQKQGQGARAGNRKQHGCFERAVMDFKDTLIKALGTVQNGTVFKRAQVYDYLIGCGYAERTATNALTPSRKGSMINTLLADGVIEHYGPLGYRIINNEAFKAMARKNTSRVVRYEGKPKDGWQLIGKASDDGAYEAELILCGQRFGKGCWNLKLFADGAMPRKANWWLQYRNGQLRGSDAATLKANMPDVYQNIIDDMKEVEA